MEERNESDKSNGEWQERKEQLKMTRTRTKRKKMDVKTLVKAEDRKKEVGGHKLHRRKGPERQISKN